MKLALLAAAAVLAAPAAFAQTSVTTTTSVAAPAAAVVVAPNSPVSDWPIRGAVVAREIVAAPVAVVSGGSSTAVMGAPAAPVVRYWWNVPADIDKREDFRRWRGLL